MEPTRPDGWLLLVNHGGSDQRHCRTFVVRKGDELIVKRTLHEPDASRLLQSGNPEKRLVNAARSWKTKRRSSGRRPSRPTSSPQPDYLLNVRGDGMDRTGLQDGNIAVIKKTPKAESGQVVVARFGDEVTLKRFVRLDKRNVELRPESYKPPHKVMKLGLAKHILDIDRVAVGTMIGAVQDISVRGTSPQRRRDVLRAVAQPLR